MADTSVSDSIRDVDDARATKAAREWARGRELADSRFEAALSAAGYAGWCHDLAARDSQWSYPQVEVIEVDSLWPSDRWTAMAARASWAFIARFEIEDAQAAAALAAKRAAEKAAKEAAEIAALNPFAVLSALKAKA